MRCPACANELVAVKIDKVTLDVCRNSCGGVWFDAGEFDLYDEAKENVPHEILRPVKSAQIAVVDRNKTRNCPHCASTALIKRFVDGTYQLQIDQCPQCAGIWLDVGELENIREDNGSLEERQDVIDDYLDQSSKSKSSDKHEKGLKAVLGLLFR